MKSWALDIENEGFQRGIKQGRGEGLELGIVQGLARTIKRMMAKMGSSLEDTMAYLQLTDDEKIKMCELVTKAGADFIKTSNTITFKAHKAGGE